MKVVLLPQIENNNSKGQTPKKEIRLGRARRLLTDLVDTLSMSARK